MNPEERGIAGLNYPAGGGNLEGLLEMALRQRFGPYGSQAIAGRLPVMQEQWQQQYPTVEGQTANTFLDYIRMKYGL